MNGFEAARQIRSIAPSTKLVMLSVFDADQMKGAAQLVGIDAFVTKSAVALDLLAAVNRVTESWLQAPHSSALNFL